MKLAQEESIREAARVEELRKELQEKKDILISIQENATLLQNCGEGNCLLYVGQQFQELKGLKVTPLPWMRKQIVDIAALLHRNWVSEQSHLSDDMKMTILSQLSDERAQHSKMGVNLGDYYKSGAPTDIDALAEMLGGRIKLHRIENNQLYRAEYFGDVNSPLLPGAILYSRLSDNTSPHFELIKLHQGYNCLMIFIISLSLSLFSVCDMPLLACHCYVKIKLIIFSFHFVSL